MPELIRRERHGRVTRLVMTSPKNYNALSVEMIAGLHTALRETAMDGISRAIILAGEGKAFCAGHDLRQMQAARANPDGGRAGYEALFKGCAQLMELITTLPRPVIAEAHGIATAAGCQLVASCDLAVAAEGTRFGVNGINIGLFCSTPMVALTRNIPAKQAFEMLFTGEFIDAHRAREIGLINRVTPPEDLQSETMALAQTIADKLPAAVALGKRAFTQNQQLSAAYAAASEVMCDNIMLDDTDEGITAFLEKRKPNWA